MKLVLSVEFDEDERTLLRTALMGVHAATEYGSDEARLISGMANDATPASPDRVRRAIVALKRVQTALLEQSDERYWHLLGVEGRVAGSLDAGRVLADARRLMLDEVETALDLVVTAHDAAELQSGRLA